MLLRPHPPSLIKRPPAAGSPGRRTSTSSLGFDLGPPTPDPTTPLPASGGTAGLAPAAAGALLSSAAARLISFDTLNDGRGRPGSAGLALFAALADARPSAPGSSAAVVAATADLLACLAGASTTPASPVAGLSWRLHLASAVVGGRGCRLATAAARGQAPPPGLREAVAADLDALQSLAVPSLELERLVSEVCAGGSSLKAPPPPPDFFEALAAAGGAEADAVAAGGGPWCPDWGGLAAGLCGAAAPTTPVGPPLTRSARLAWAGRLLSSADADGRWSGALPALEALWAAHSWGNTGGAGLFEWEDGSLSPSADEEAVVGEEGWWGGGGGGVVAPASQRPPALVAPLAALAAWARTLDPAPPLPYAIPSPGPLWPGVCADAGLRCSGARLLRLGPAALADPRPLWRAVRAHPRVRWVGVVDRPLTDEEGRGMAGRPLNVALVVPAE